MTTDVTAKPSWKPWLVCLSAALFFYYVFFQLAMFNTISRPLLHSFNIHSTALGYLSSSYFFADALFIIPAGILLDRYSIRKIALVMMTLCVLATFTFAATSSYPLAMLCRAITGAGNAFAFLASMQLASRWLPPKRLALGIGLVITIIMVGGMAAQAPLTLVMHAVGWRGAMLINAGIGLAFLIYMFYMMQDFSAGKEHKANKDSHQHLFSNLIASAKNPQNWYCGSFTAFMNLPISLLGELWGIMYLSKAHHFSDTTAASIAGMIFFGMLIGSPAMGWLSDKIKRRRRPMIVCAILILIVVLIIIYSGINSAILLGLLFFLLGLLASAQVISYPTIAESNPLTITGTSMSVVAIMLNLVSFIAQPLFGWLMHLRHPASAVGHSAIYTVSDFHLAMLLLPLAFIISLLLAVKVKETFCEPLNK
jgi:MFS family permease